MHPRGGQLLWRPAPATRAGLGWRAARRRRRWPGGQAPHSGPGPDAGAPPGSRGAAAAAACCPGEGAPHPAATHAAAGELAAGSAEQAAAAAVPPHVAVVPASALRVRTRILQAARLRGWASCCAAPSAGGQQTRRGTQGAAPAPGRGLPSPVAVAKQLVAGRPAARWPGRRRWETVPVEAQGRPPEQGQASQAAQHQGAHHTLSRCRPGWETGRQQHGRVGQSVHSWRHCVTAEHCRRSAPTRRPAPRSGAASGTGGQHPGRRSARRRPGRRARAGAGTRPACWPAAAPSRRSPGCPHGAMLRQRRRQQRAAPPPGYGQGKCPAALQLTPCHPGHSCRRERADDAPLLFRTKLAHADQEQAFGPGAALCTRDTVAAERSPLAWTRGDSRTAMWRLAARRVAISLRRQAGSCPKASLSCLPAHTASGRRFATAPGSAVKEVTTDAEYSTALSSAKGTALAPPGAGWCSPDTAWPCFPSHPPLRLDRDRLHRHLVWPLPLHRPCVRAAGPGPPVRPVPQG